MPNTDEIITDEQTGQQFKKIPEKPVDVIAGWISAAYSLAVLALFAWVLLDTWSGSYGLLKKLFAPEFVTRLKASTIFNLMVYTAVGGAMGAAINNLRSFISWHAERQAFGWRFIWKYIALPPLGGTLAVLVYGILQSGMAVFNGGNPGGVSAITSLSAWATGTLAGYGSHKVFIWLDDKVNTLFKVETKKVSVPDVVDKSPDEARQMLIDAQLAVGDVSEVETTDPQKVGKVIGQTPPAGTEIVCESKVAITVGVPAREGANTGTAERPDVTGKTKEEAEQILQNGKLTGANESAAVSAAAGVGGLATTTVKPTDVTVKTESEAEQSSAEGGSGVDNPDKGQNP